MAAWCMETPVRRTTPRTVWIVLAKEKIAEANASASCAIVAGLTCTSIQTMSALGNLEVEWHEPMKSCLNLLSIFGFNIRWAP
eukprot:2358733-Amphidinium_carterae.1